MPTPQSKSFFMEQASCLFGDPKIKIILCGTGILPVQGYPKIKIILCGTGILPVLENGARSQLNLDF